MIDAQDFTKALFEALKKQASIHKLKYSPRFHGIYHVNENRIWRARVIPGFLLSNNTLDVKMVVSIGATCFDVLLASIVNPDKNARISELNHAAGIYVGPSLLITEKTYTFQFCDNSSIADRAYDAALMIVKDAVDSVSEMETKIVIDYTDMVSYMMSLRESHPMECGLAYLTKQEYQLACDVFRYAADQGKFWHISYGPKARMLHLILIDYCNAMQNGIEWRDEYVINGLHNK